jgi:acetyltransferase-like isoleucine patch superfamily enzyme
MRRTLKPLVDALATLVVLPAVALHAVGAALCGPAEILPFWSQAFALVPGRTGVFLRRAFLRFVLAHVGRDVWIGFGTVFTHPGARLGDRVYLGHYCVVGDVDVGDEALIASQVSLMNGTAQHGIERLDVPVREQPGRFERISVGRDAWLGERAVIAADVGAQAVIGAGAVVTRPIPDRGIALGIPARVVKYRGETDRGGSASGAALAVAVAESLELRQ